MLTNILWFGLGVLCTLAALFVAVCLQSKAWDYDGAAERMRNLDRLERDQYGG